MYSDILTRPPQLPPPTPRDNADYLELQIAEAQALKAARERATVDRVRHTPSIVDYIENRVINPDTVNTVNWDYTNAQGITLADFQKRILTHVLTPDPSSGIFPYRTVIWSAPKKSGKTANAAFVGAWFAEYIEAPNLVLLGANTQGQSLGRIHASMLPTLRLHGARTAGERIILPNGTVVQSITNSPKSEAGANYGLVMISELWGWSTELARTLWAETMPVPTKMNSIRWVESYVGYEDTSTLLLELWLKVFTDTSESKLQDGAEPIPELADITTTDAYGNKIPCCYRVPAEDMFLYVDHEHRFPWQQGERGKKYYRSITTGLTEADVMRLVYNRWQKTDTRFIAADMLAKAVMRGRDLTADGLSLFSGVPRRVPSSMKLTIAVDASQGRTDSTALAGVYSEFDEPSDASDTSTSGIRFRCGYFKAYAPTGEDFDLDNMVGDEIVRLWKAGLIKRREPDPKESALIKDNPFLTPIAVYYDPTQMHQVAVNLKKRHKLLIKEFQQGNDRLKADTFLHRCFKNDNIDVPDDPTLTSHLEAAKAQHQTKMIDKKQEELDARIRIVKPKAAVHAIDGAVALSMATYAESLTPPTRRRGFGVLHLDKTKGLT